MHLHFQNGRRVKMSRANKLVSTNLGFAKRELNYYHIFYLFTSRMPLQKLLSLQDIERLFGSIRCQIETTRTEGKN